MDEQARRRILLVEARLANARPIWQRHNGWQLYRSSDGYYVVRYQGNAGTTYLGISVATGEVKDISGAAVDIGDIQIVTSSLSGAGLSQVRDRVLAWSARRRPS